MDAWRRGSLRWLACAACLVLTACQSTGTKGPSWPGKTPPQGSGKDANVEPAPEPNVSARTHLAAGRLHESQGHIQRAIEQYRTALSLDAKLVEAHDRLGVCLTQFGQFAEAEQQFIKAIEIEPAKAHLRNNLGFCYISQRRWSDAEAELRNALELKPDFVRARVNLGMVLAQQKKLDDARETFRAVLKEEDAQFNMGLMYQSLSRYADASAAFEAALKANPKLVAAQQRLDKIRPLVEAEKNKARESADTATSRPAVAAVTLDDMAPMPSKADAPAARAVGTRPADTADRTEGAAVQASPQPGPALRIAPTAFKALATLKNAVARAAVTTAQTIRSLEAAERAKPSPGPLLVHIDAAAHVPTPMDIEQQDDRWLNALDPMWVFDRVEPAREAD